MINKKTLLVILTILIITTYGCVSGDIVHIGNDLKNGGMADSNESFDNEAEAREDEIILDLLTKQEFLQYLSENDVGLAEEDFEGIDLDDFIRSCGITSESIEQLLPNMPKTVLIYRMLKVIAQEHAIYAKEIRSVDSSDEEYEAFIVKLMEEIGCDYNFLGKDFYGLDSYEVFLKTGRLVLMIGRTRDIPNYIIKDGGDDSFGSLFIDFPVSDMFLSLFFCYSGDYKFFIVDSYRADNEEAHEIYKTFTQINKPE